MLDFRKSEDGVSGEVPEEDPDVAKKKALKRESEKPADEQTPTDSSDHFATQSEGRIALKKFLASGGQYGFPGTDGTRSSNFKQYLRNSHPLLSIWTAHEEHPFDRWERLQFLVCMLSITFMLAAMFSLGKAEPQAICDDGCELVSSASCAPGVAQCCQDNCASGMKEDQRDPTKCDEWASEIQYDDACKFISNSKFVTPIIVALVTIPIDMFMRAIMTCGCVQGWAIQKTCEDVGSCCMKIVMCYALIFFIFGIVAAAMNDFGLVVITFAMAQVESWIIFFFKSFVLFNLFYGGAKAKFRKKYPGLISIEIKGLPKVGSTGGDLHLPDIQGMKNAVNDKMAAVNDKMANGLQMFGIKGPNVQQEPQTQQQQQQAPPEIHMQRVDQQPPSNTTIMVMCPPGAVAGQQIQFDTASGPMTAVVPQGVAPGQQFPVITGPPPQPQTVVSQVAPPAPPTQSNRLAGFGLPSMSGGKKPAAGGLLDLRGMVKGKK